MRGIYTVVNNSNYLLFFKKIHILFFFFIPRKSIFEVVKNIFDYLENINDALVNIFACLKNKMIGYKKSKRIREHKHHSLILFIATNTILQCINFYSDTSPISDVLITKSRFFTSICIVSLYKTSTLLIYYT